MVKTSSNYFLNKVTLGANIFIVTTLQLAFGLLILASQAYCDPGITVNLSAEKGSIGDPIQLVVTITEAEPGQLPTLSSSQDFNVVMRGNKASVSIINGEINTSISYTYQLTARRIGELTTPNIEVQTKSGILQAPGKKIVITKEPEIADTPPTDQKAFLRQHIGEKEVYIGQQVVNTLSLYTQVELRNMSFRDETVDGVWEEKFGNEKQTTKEVGGKPFTAVEVKKALYPLRSGVIKVPTREILAQALDQQQVDPFGFSMLDPFWGANFKEIRLRSNELELYVKDLPPLPPEFPGNDSISTIVGETLINSEYTPEVSKVGGTKSFTIEVSSVGNLNPLKSLRIPEVDGIKIYPEQPITREDSAGAELVLHKIFKYSIVPLKPGFLRIPGIKITYFDPKSGQYKVAESKEIGIAVEGKPLSVTLQPSISPGKVNLFKPTEERASPHLSNGTIMFLLVGAILFGILVFYIARKRRKLDLVDLRSLDTCKNVKELNNNFVHLLLEILGEKKQGLTKDVIAKVVQDKIQDKSLVFRILSVLDALEYEIYGRKEDQYSADLERYKKEVSEILGASSLSMGK